MVLGSLRPVRAMFIAKSECKAGKRQLVLAVLRVRHLSKPKYVLNQWFWIARPVRQVVSQPRV